VQLAFELPFGIRAVTSEQPQSHPDSSKCTLSEITTVDLEFESFVGSQELIWWSLLLVGHCLAENEGWAGWCGFCLCAKWFICQHTKTKNPPLFEWRLRGKRIEILPKSFQVDLLYPSIHYRSIFESRILPLLDASPLTVPMLCAVRPAALRCPPPADAPRRLASCRSEAASGGRSYCRHSCVLVTSSIGTIDSHCIK
jgi:hypothetical protein